MQNHQNFPSTPSNHPLASPSEASFSDGAGAPSTYERFTPSTLGSHEEGYQFFVGPMDETEDRIPASDSDCLIDGDEVIYRATLETTADSHSKGESGDSVSQETKSKGDSDETYSPKNNVELQYVPCRKYNLRSSVRGKLVYYLIPLQDEDKDRLYWGRFKVRYMDPDAMAALIEKASLLLLLGGYEEIYQVTTLRVTQEYAQQFGLWDSEDAVAQERVMLNEPFHLLPCGHILRPESAAGWYHACREPVPSCPSCRDVALPSNLGDLPLVRLPYLGELDSLLERVDTMEDAQEN